MRPVLFSSTNRDSIAVPYLAGRIANLITGSFTAIRQSAVLIYEGFSAWCSSPRCWWLSPTNSADTFKIAFIDALGSRYADIGFCQPQAVSSGDCPYQR
jgi:hypothetical protein